MRYLPVFSVLLFSFLVSCEKPEQNPASEDDDVEAAVRRMKNDIAQLEADAEDFREKISRAMDQHAVSDFTPEQLEILRKNEIEIPGDVEIPSKE